MQSLLPIRGSLGKGYLECRHECWGCRFQRKLFEIEFRCLPQIRQRFGDGITLGRRPRLRIVGNVSSVSIRSQNGGECHDAKIAEESPVRNLLSLRSGCRTKKLKTAGRRAFPLILGNGNSGVFLAATEVDTSK